jgi:DNA repair protein RadC
MQETSAFLTIFFAGKPSNSHRAPYTVIEEALGKVAVKRVLHSNHPIVDRKPFSRMANEAFKHCERFSFIREDKLGYAAL